MNCIMQGMKKLDEDLQCHDKQTPRAQNHEGELGPAKIRGVYARWVLKNGPDSSTQSPCHGTDKKEGQNSIRNIANPLPALCQFVVENIGSNVSIHRSRIAHCRKNDYDHHNDDEIYRTGDRIPEEVSSQHVNIDEDHHQKENCHAYQSENFACPMYHVLN